MSKIFLDTNIVADLLLEREPWVDSIETILNIYDYGLFDDLVCSSISLGTVYYLMTRAKIPHNMIIDKFKRFRRLCRIASVGERTFDMALQSQFLDLEDAMQYYSALSEGCDVIITRNKKDFSEAQIDVMEPQELLDEFYNQTEYQPCT